MKYITDLVKHFNNNIDTAARAERTRDLPKEFLIKYEQEITDQVLTNSMIKNNTFCPTIDKLHTLDIVNLEFMADFHTADYVLSNGLKGYSDIGDYDNIDLNKFPNLTTLTYHPSDDNYDLLKSIPDSIKHLSVLHLRAIYLSNLDILEISILDDEGVSLIESLPESIRVFYHLNRCRNLPLSYRTTKI